MNTEVKKKYIAEKKTGNFVRLSGKPGDRAERRKSPAVNFIKRAGAMLIFLPLMFSLLTLVTPEAIFARDGGQTGQISGQPRTELEELEKILRALERFDHSQGEGPALALERLVFRLKDEPGLRPQVEKKLLEFFTGNVTADARIAVSKPLSWIAGSESVKALARLLPNVEKTDAARYVLERIPGEEASRALIEALGKAPAAVLPGIISSLGHRRVEAAVPEFEKILSKKPATGIVSNIIEALGNTGGQKAVEILSGYLKASDENLRQKAADGLLRISSRAIDQKNYPQAAKISAMLLEARLLPEGRMAAWKIKIIAAGEKQNQELASALKSRDEAARSAALELLPILVKKEEIGSFIPLIAGLPENFQVQAAAVLAHYSAPEARDYLMTLAEKSLSPDVRAEALLSLGKAGDHSTVEFLAGKAASARGKEKAAARESLAGLAGRAVDEKILELLAQQPQQALRNELLLASCERNIVESRKYFLLEAANPTADVSLVSRGLKAFGDIGLAEELLPVAFRIEDENFRAELAGIMAAWARQSARPEARSAYFRNLLGRESEAKNQALLISIIGKIGERNSLPLLRQYLDNRNPEVREAALRAIVDWPELEARDDLLKIARTSSELKEKVLAIRGLVRLTAAEKYRLPQAAVETLKEMYALSPRAEEKKLVLAVFPDFPCREALAFCESLSSDPEVGAEARLAAEKISHQLNRTR
ncbi:MAG: HEAT repeat domain-containing protein [Candidatus Saccharicenans sp.]|nr:HEAT repeat domain-containing protein [Candidatus Saccharicenans sp.]